MYLMDYFDQATRAAFVEFNIYNANVDIFASVVMCVEFTASGAIIPTTRVAINKSLEPLYETHDVAGAHHERHPDVARVHWRQPHQSSGVRYLMRTGCIFHLPLHTLSSICKVFGISAVIRVLSDLNILFSGILQKREMEEVFLLSESDLHREQCLANHCNDRKDCDPLNPFIHGSDRDEFIFLRAPGLWLSVRVSSR